MLEPESDVGFLEVTPLGHLDLRLAFPERETSAATRAHVVLFFTRMGPRSTREQRTIPVQVHGDGSCPVPAVRSGEIAGFVWTPDGWFGEIPPTYRVPHGRCEPLDVPMRAPGKLDVSLHAPFDRDAGWRVVAVDALHGFGARAFRARPDGGRTRLAVQPVGTRDRVEIDGLWAVEYEVSLVSPEGLVAASARATVWAGHTTPVDVVVGRDRASLTVRSAAAEPVRCMILRDDDGGVCCTVSIPARGERRVRGLPPGRYGLLRLPARSLTPSRKRTLDVPRRLTVDLAPGESRVFDLEQQRREPDPRESGQ